MMLMEIITRDSDRVYINPQDILRLEPAKPTAETPDPHIIIVMRNGGRIETYEKIHLLAKKINAYRYNI